MRLTICTLLALAAAAPALAQTGPAPRTIARPGKPVPEGAVVFAQPSPPLIEAAPADAAPGAVLLTATMRFDEHRWRTLRALVFAKPYSGAFPKGSIFAARLRAEGGTELCLAHGNGEHFKPIERPGDGHFYTAACLEKPVSATRFGVIRLKPYGSDWAIERVTMPVELEPAPSLEKPLVTSLYAVRRLRVTAVAADSATVALEDGAFRLPADDPDPARLIPLSDYVQRETVTLPLREGANAVVHGLTLTAHRDGAQWRIAASGRVAPFAHLTERGEGFVIEKP